MRHDVEHSGNGRPTTHALVVGGTGMLRGVSLELADEFDMVSVVARTSARLNELRDLARDPERLHPVRLDWHDVPTVLERLAEAIDLHGPPRLVVCWCHTSAATTPIEIAQLVNASVAMPVPFVHLLGSSSPETHPVKSTWRDTIRELPRIDYRMVQLGCERIGHTFRWLSHDVICDGVMQSVREGEPFLFIGDRIP